MPRSEDGRTEDLSRRSASTSTAWSAVEIDCPGSIPANPRPCG